MINIKAKRYLNLSNHLTHIIVFIVSIEVLAALPHNGKTTTNA